MDPDLDMVGLDIVTFRTPGLGDSSHLLTHDGVGILVDPQRDVDRFLGAAAERDVGLRFVLETHLHNDYVSGAGEAARRSGAELVLPAAAAPVYRHTPAFHLEDIPGDAGLTVTPLHTPGHTPEHTSYLVLLDGEPVAVFSGGSLLVASAGRADLLGPERADTLARLQHRSLRRLAGLPRKVLLLPTHGEGSFCTATGVGRRTTSTIGLEIDSNPMLAPQVTDEDTFAEQLLAGPAPIPAFYRQVGPLNLRGGDPMPAVEVPEVPAAALTDPAGAGLAADTEIVDIRPRQTMAAGFTPGATGVELSDDFGSWVGWLVPHQAPIVLVAEQGQDVAEAVTQLARIGVDTVRGVVVDPPGPARVSFPLVDLDTFVALATEPAAQLLDVRMRSERAEVAVPGSVWRFVADLVADGVPEDLARARPVLVACANGRRATIAATVLHRAGYRPVVLSGAGNMEVAERLARGAA